jgi:hypothetical protein
MPGRMKLNGPKGCIKSIKSWMTTYTQINPRQEK